MSLNLNIKLSLKFNFIFFKSRLISSVKFPKNSLPKKPSADPVNIINPL